jgi:hypothetical protein
MSASEFMDKVKPNFYADLKSFCIFLGLNAEEQDEVDYLSENGLE